MPPQSYNPLPDLREQMWAMLNAGYTPDQAIKIAQVETGNMSPFLSAAQEENLGKADKALQLLGNYQTLLEPLDFADTGFGAMVQKPFLDFGIKTNLAPNWKMYEDVASGTTSTIVKALGEVGALSDADRAAARTLLPRAGDTQTQADMKMKMLKNIFIANKNTALRQGQM